MNRLTLLERLIDHEGMVLKPYKDSLGVTTIGIGRNLDDRGITEEEARSLCLNDIAIAEGQLDANLPWWRSLDEARQQVLAEMAFNLGWPRLSKFFRFIEAVQQKDWPRATHEMLDSQWRRQVGKRAITLSDAMLKGSF